MADPNATPTPLPAPVAAPAPAPRRSLWDSLESQPFKTTILVNTLALIYSYIIVVLFSIWIEPVDFGIPLKWVFLFATISTFLTIMNKIYIAANNRNIDLLFETGQNLIFQSAILLTSIISLLSFVGKDVSVGKVINLDIYTKISMSIAVFSPTLFTLRPIREEIVELRNFIGLRRRRQP